MSITLDKKCTIVSFADALAYQYPHKLKEIGVFSPLQFVKLILSDAFKKFKELQILPDRMLNDIRTKFMGTNSGQGHPFIWPIMCYYMGIDIFTCTYDIVISCKVPSRQREAEVCFQNILKRIPRSENKLYNIQSVRLDHVEFIPFATVQTKEAQNYYEQYHQNSAKELAAQAKQNVVEEELECKLVDVELDFDLNCLN